MVCTGLELALGLVPLVVTATEHHQKAYRKFKMMVTPDDELEDFLADLHDEISLLGHTLNCLISDLTTLSEKQRERLMSLDRVQWEQDSVDIALKARLGGDAESAFKDILNRLLKSLDEVVSERSLRFIASDETWKSSPAFFKKLEGFRKDMENGATVHDLRSRFQFTTRADRRKVNIKRISKCNKKLERFVHGNPARFAGEGKRNSGRKTQPPTNRSRRLSQDVHNNIARNWSCPCPLPHEARLGLLKCLMSQQSTDLTINLDLLVSMAATDQAGEFWLETRIRILPDINNEETRSKPIIRFIDENELADQRPVLIEPRYHIDKPVCTLIKEAHKNNKKLELVFDGQKLWQTRSSGSHPILRPEAGVPLKDLLEASEPKLKLKERRALAVVLAHAILHYCESPWLSDNWNKEHVNFFANTTGLDLMRPYLATQFETLSNTPEEPTSNIYSHPSPALLSLGILLLELYVSKPIESFWELDDTENGKQGANTNWITAEKMLERMGDDLYEGYRNAVQACLNVDYFGTEDKLSLQDEKFRKLVFDRVVVPLEDELKNGFHVTPEELGVL